MGLQNITKLTYLIVFNFLKGSASPRGSGEGGRCKGSSWWNNKTLWEAGYFGKHPNWQSIRNCKFGTQVLSFPSVSVCIII